MLLQLFAQLPQMVTFQKNGTEKKGGTAADLAESREHLYKLLCFVQQEIIRVEQIFNLAEDETLLENSIYMLKSLRAQQQFLVQNLRRLEGVGVRDTDNAMPQQEAVKTEDELTREGYAMG